MNRQRSRLACVSTVLFVALMMSRGHAANPPPAQPVTGPLWVYIGTYTGPKSASKGVYVSKLDLATGALSPPELAAETTSPSFLALHPNRQFLYAVGEVGEFAGKKTGSVSAFAIDADTGKLKPLNSQSSGGTGPCHLTVDETGKAVVVANYGGGSVAALPVGEDGTLKEPTAVIQHQGSSVNPKRQEGPHAHCIKPDPGNRFVLATDLGLDKVLVYRFDPAKGTLTPHDPPAATLAPGAGPRHFAFHPNGQYVYVINELASTVTAFAYDADRGALSELQTVSTLPEGFKGNTSTAEVQVHPSGKFLYGSNRGHDSIASFRIDEQTGKLTPIGHTPTGGKTPRNFGIDPTGAYLIAANQNTGNLVVFRIDPQGGELKPTGAAIEVGSPVCVKFLPAGK